MSFKPTPEQEHCKVLVKSNDTTKIDAGAGAAKTTTLSLVAHENPEDSLYLAFNKAMVTEAGDRFPSWVEVKTTHSLAYGVFGAALRGKLQRPQGRYVNVCGTGSEIAKYFKINSQESVMGKRITANGIGQSVRDTVNSFEYSADDQIGETHVSYKALSKLSKEDKFDMAFYRLIVIEAARKLWALRCDLTSQVLATHDTYLKLYQLSKPDLSKKYKIIYLDEGQDTNNCVLDIFLRQTTKKVIVGDEFQQIYAFRGSVNAMQKITAATGNLTTSFRFGQKVADLANIILEKPAGAGLKGWDQLTTQVVKRSQQGELPAVHTRLYRTNAALLADAVLLIEEGKRVNLEIDIKDFLRKMESAVALSKGLLKDVKHEDLLAYETWKELEEEDNNGELGRIVKIVNNGNAARVMEVLVSHRNSDNPQIIMTTAHKSKGREWDYVVLASDFPSIYDREGNYVGLDQMEKNLLYVAVTRAKKGLWMNGTCDDIVERHELQKSISGSHYNDERAEMAHFCLHTEMDAEYNDVRHAVFG